MLTLVASALAGGDCIDDADVLRTGGQSPDPGRHGQGAIHPGDVPAQLPVEPRPPAGSGEPGAALDSTSARRQLALLVPCCLLANRAMRREIAGHRRRKDPPQRIGGPDLGIHPSGVRRLIDTCCGSHSCHYVNHSVRGFRAPGSRRIASARFGPSRLRIRRIIRPRVVAPAIQSAPVATHSVATIAHLAFSLAGTILIPDCAPPQHLSPAFFPQLSPAPIHSSGRSRP